MYQTYPNSGNVGAAVGGAFLFGTLIYLVIMIVFIAAYWQMFKKAGYSGALSLLLLVPLANVVLILWFGFSEWPVVRENRELRGRLAGGGVGGPPTYPPAAMPPAYAPPAQPVAPPTYAPPAPAAPPPAYQPPPVAPAPEVAPSAPATPAYEPPPAAPTPPQTTPPPAPPGAEPPAGS
jgi:hypothetical protein